MMATMDASVKKKEFQGELKKEGSQGESYGMEVMCSALISKKRKNRSSLTESSLCNCSEIPVFLGLQYEC